MTITLYGIPNCDTVKKARTWLDEQQLPYTFHDFKKAGVSPAFVQTCLEALSWEILVNRKGTTWRKLDESRRAAVVDAASASVLMQEQPSVIKRPVLIIAKPGEPNASIVHVGFSAPQYQQLFNLS
jgi:arsenate reductase (glutaredoxin)